MLLYGMVMNSHVSVTDVMGEADELDLPTEGDMIVCHPCREGLFYCLSSGSLPNSKVDAGKSTLCVCSATVA